MREKSFRILMDELVTGDGDAADRIVSEYTAALVAVARRQIGPRLGRRVDAEDVVQSTYRSLFVRLQRGEFELANGEDLWRLLVTIVLNKVRRQARFHRAARRNLDRESSVVTEEGQGIEASAPSEEPTPEEAALLVDELQHFLASLSDRDRPIVELRLQGLSSAEIAQETGRAERSVRRVLEHIRKRLETMPAET